MFCLFLCTKGGCTLHQDPSRRQMAHSSWVIWEGCTKECADSVCVETPRDTAVHWGCWPRGTGLHPLTSRRRRGKFTRWRAILQENKLAVRRGLRVEPGAFLEEGAGFACADVARLNYVSQNPLVRRCVIREGHRESLRWDLEGEEKPQHFCDSHRLSPVYGLTSLAWCSGWASHRSLFRWFLLQLLWHLGIRECSAPWWRALPPQDTLVIMVRGNTHWCEFQSIHVGLSSSLWVSACPHSPRLHIHLPSCPLALWTSSSSIWHGENRDCLMSPAPSIAYSQSPKTNKDVYVCVHTYTHAYVCEHLYISCGSASLSWVNLGCYNKIP